MGSWQVLPYSAPILPIHAVVLRANRPATCKILLIAGSGNNAQGTAGVPNDTAVWDVSAGTFTRPQVPLDPATGEPLDVLCVAQSVLPDGNVLISGGTLRYEPFYGLPTAFVFNAATEQWIRIANMSGGRWYPTQVLLANGRVFSASGLNGTDGTLNMQPELSAADPLSGGGWSIFPPTQSPFPMYGHMFLLNTGQLFFSGASFFGQLQPRLLNLPADPTQSIVETPIGGPAVNDFGNQAASVLLPPAQSQRVMIIGGGGGSPQMGTTRVAITSDLTAASPAYSLGPPLTRARMHHSAVILPDRTVLVCNGSGMMEDPSTSMLPAEIYNPATNTWTVAEAPTVPRVYHSNAVLLPDGRVATMGGNPTPGTNELRLEIYSPSYMTRKRPVIDSAPTNISYGSTFNIATKANLRWVSLIRPSATTHTMDTDQRLVDLPITSKRNAPAVTVSVPSNRNLAPPGWYMLFLTDTTGTPSTAAWVLLS
jgi:Domain of unknown function (DUF1929)